jgi:bifunctional non-homologous end joining protein LigD
MPQKAELVVEDRKIQVSNLDKVLYPKAGFAKGQVIDYFIRIAPVLLPHLRDRPLTMKRYPNGVEANFFEKIVHRIGPSGCKRQGVERAIGE